MIFSNLWLAAMISAGAPGIAGSHLPWGKLPGSKRNLMNFEDCDNELQGRLGKLEQVGQDIRNCACELYMV